MVMIMDNICMKKFLKYLKNNNLIKSYEIIFDKYFNYDDILNISQSDAYDIISSNEYCAVIRLYEILNGVYINDELKEKILGFSDKEKIKYALRIAISSLILDEDKLKYIEVLNECRSENIKHSYGILCKKEVLENIHSFDYAKMVGTSNYDVSLLLTNLIFEDSFLKKDDSYEFSKCVSKAESEYTARYMIELYKEFNTPLSFIEKMLNTEDYEQAKYTYKLMSNDDILKRDDALDLINKISISDEPKRDYNEILGIKERDIGYETCSFNEVLKTRNIDKIILSLSVIDGKTEIKGNTKVKKYK